MVDQTWIYVAREQWPRQLRNVEDSPECRTATVSNKTDRGMQLVDQIPASGWIRCRPYGQTPGAGRWDTVGAIFRCIVACDKV